MAYPMKSFDMMAQVRTGIAWAMRRAREEESELDWRGKLFVGEGGNSARLLSRCRMQDPKTYEEVGCVKVARGKEHAVSRMNVGGRWEVGTWREGGECKSKGNNGAPPAEPKGFRRHKIARDWPQGKGRREREEKRRKKRWKSGRCR